MEGKVERERERERDKEGVREREIERGMESDTIREEVWDKDDWKESERKNDRERKNNLYVVRRRS